MIDQLVFNPLISMMALPLETFLTLQCKKVMVTHFPGLMTAYWSLKTAYEPELRYVSGLCEPGKIIVDVGAHVGTYTTACWPHAKICYAFEPHPAYAKRLKGLFSKLQDRVSVQEIALSDKTGDAVFRSPSADPARSTIAPENRLSEFSEVDATYAEVRRLDDYKLSPVGFIKIDVEGHEEAVVSGASETIARDRPNLMIEIEERHNPGGLHRLSSTLRAWGYEGWFLRGGQFRQLSEFFSQIGESTDKDVGSNKLYINNFVFSCDPSLGDRLSRRRRWI
jgi:FkbM family methyltransferase